MADTIVISDGEEDDELPRAENGTESRDWDIIDLTSHHCALGNLPELDSSVIDLTMYEDGLGNSPVASPLKDELSSSDNSYSGGLSEYEEETSGCSWRTDSDSTSTEDGVLQSSISRNECLTDESILKDQCLPYRSNLDELADPALPLEGWSPLLPPASAEGNSDYASIFPEVNCQHQFEAGSITSLPTAEETYPESTAEETYPESTAEETYPESTAEETYPESTAEETYPESTAEETYPESTAIPFNKALLYKLQCFKKSPVCHFFHKLHKPEQSGSLKPIPHTRMTFVNNTREENIHQGTLHFLSEFVTAKHFPPKEIIMHVIQSILLGAEERAIQDEAYMTLMKVQKLHPASLNTVAWDWSLLSEVMERQDRHTSLLFLQYVVQTLDDDFEIHLKLRRFQKSLCKTMLSCDHAKVKNVIAWLMNAVENACDIAINMELDERSECEQRMVFLLQRMLSIAVEVDNQPVLNSKRIADLLFPYVIVLKTRQQRELFFISTENHLLRAKILELIFRNSCEPVPALELPLSLVKILHFIGNSMLLLENEGPEWQRWDEILHHICLLFLSLQRILKDHLLTPITERTDVLCQRPHMQSTDDVTATDVEHCLSLFWSRTAIGSDVPEELRNRFLMLKALLLASVKRLHP